METITTKGKTTKEALNLALKQLNKKFSEVDVETVKYEEKGFLGFKPKQAIVKVTVKKIKSEFVNGSTIMENNSSIEMNNKQESPIHKANVEQEVPLEITNIIQEDLSGKAWVIDGKVFCKDSPNQYALIDPTEDVRVYKNGNLIHSTTVINETDVVKVEIMNDDLPPSWDIKLSEDKMKAYIEVKAGRKISRVLKDKKPSSYIKLEVEDACTSLNISVDDVLGELRKLHITHGIDYEAITKACTLGKDGIFLIAKGTPTIKGKNGFFKLSNNFEEKNQMKERLDGSIDFKEIREFPSVNYGEIIGEVIPPVEGRAGTSVLGNTVDPEKVYPLKLKAGTGVLIVDNTKVVATAVGSPEVKIREDTAIVSVLPKIIISNDVTMETGNIHYLGNVDITASIQDGMTVEANGNILVEGNTFRAKVLSGKSIIVKNNVIASHLTVGNGSLVKVELSRLLMTLANELHKMNAAINQLSQISTFNVESLKITGLGPLIKVLYDSKFKNFPPLITDIVEKIKAASTTLETEWIDFAEQLYRNFVTVQVDRLH